MRLRHYSKHSLFALLFSVFFFLSGCAIQLAPSYDKTVVDGLNSVNTDSMTLLASLGNGTQASDFNNRSAQYAAVIGKLDSLAILAGARPLPKTKVSEAVNAYLEKRGISTLSDDSNSIPSANAIKKISETLTKMRDTDQKQGVTGFEVRAFKGQVTIYFDQAITYENFLQR